VVLVSNFEHEREGEGDREARSGEGEEIDLFFPLLPPMLVLSYRKKEKVIKNIFKFRISFFETYLWFR
jgi:hypothetical protein